MKVLNFGSMNVDYVYQVDHMVVEGETQLSSGMNVFSGGKGLNQSIALSKAGLNVDHAGIIGEDGDILLEELQKYGVDTSNIQKLPVKGGHTIIQIDQYGRNCILLYGGTNQMLTKEFIHSVLASYGEGDYLVLQNEVNLLGEIIDVAFERGMKIVLNPSPFDDRLKECDLTKVDLFLLNEIEGGQFTGETEPEKILDALAVKFPNTRVVLTLGSDGAWYSDKDGRVFQEIFPVKAVDTTAAGDTFTGFFIAKTAAGATPAEALRVAAKASSIAVTREGAAASVPTMEEVEESLGLK